MEDPFYIAGQNWVHTYLGKQFKVSTTTFAVSSLAKRSGSWKPENLLDYEIDHGQYVKWWRQSVAIISHSYAPKDKIDAAMSKLQTQYPQLVALFIDEESWWDEGCTPFIIMHREDYTGNWGQYCVSRKTNSDRRIK